MIRAEANADYETERTTLQTNSNWLSLQGVRYEVQVEATMQGIAM
jgi:hypothetical protein